MRKVKIALAGFLVFTGVIGYLLFTGPRMKIQPSLQAYNSVMPLPAKGSVPLESPWPQPESWSVPASAANLARGKVYYEYYCVSCHGDSGSGDGPVGQSYTPVPSDLRSPKLAGYSDEQYLRAMLTGVGHSPSLERIVPPVHRPYLLLYSRNLSTGAATRPAGR